MQKLESHLSVDPFVFSIRRAKLGLQERKWKREHLLPSQCSRCWISLWAGCRPHSEWAMHFSDHLSMTVMRESMLLVITCFVFVQIKKCWIKPLFLLSSGQFQIETYFYHHEEWAGHLNNRPNLFIISLSLQQCGEVAGSPALLIFPFLWGSSTMMGNRHGCRKLSFLKFLWLHWIVCQIYTYV